MNNCLCAALGHKLFHWQDTRLRVRWNERWEIPHFYWYVPSKGKCYHFAAADKSLATYKMLWFQGRVERFFWHP